jgi:gliding motility-associated-like protein
MSMYSRWANYVTTINNLEEGWDGIENGNIIQEVTYIYVFKFTDVFHEDHNLRGRVSIIKQIRYL